MQDEHAAVVTAEPGSGEPDGVGEVTKRAARTVAASVIAETVGKAGTFLFVLIGARVLTTDEFGAFSFALAAATLLAAIPQWGFDSIVVRDAAREPGRLGVLLAETWVLRLLLSVPVLLGAAIFGAFTRPDVESELAFVLVVGASLLDAFTQIGRAAAASRQRYGGVALAHVLQRLSTAILGGAALAVGFELVGFSSAYLLGSVIGVLAVGVAIRRLGVRADFRRVTWHGIARLWRDSSALGIDLLLAMAVLRLDAILLGAFKDDSAVATYALATRVVETVLFLAWAVQHGLFPMMSASEVVWRVRLAIERGMALVAVAYIPFLVIMVLRGGEVIGAVFGTRYADPAADPAAWLAPAPLLIAFGNIVTLALISRGQTRQVLVGTIVAVTSNVGLNLVLIPPYGAEGAAIATTAAYALECIVLLGIAARAVGIPRLDASLAPAGVAGALMTVVMLVMPGGAVVEIATGTLTFLVSWFVLTRAWAPEHLAVVTAFVKRRVPEDYELLRVSTRRPLETVKSVSWVAIPLGAAVLGVVFGVLGTQVGPLAMIALPVLAIGFGACLSRPAWAIVGVFASLPAALDPIPIGNLQVIDVAMVAAVVAVAVSVLAARTATSLRIPALGWGVALCATAALAVPGAIDTSRATTRVVTLVAGLLLAVAIVAACRKLADIRLLVATFLAVGLVMTVIAFQDLTGLRAESGGLVVRERASGVFGDPNELGSFAVVLLLTALGVLLARVAPAMRWLAAAAAALAAGALILSLSRGSWIGAGFGIVGLMILVPRARRALLGLLAVGVALGLTIGAFRAGSPEIAVIRERFGTLTSSLDSPYDDRPQIWAEARREITAKPWLGWGPANFELASARSGSESRRVGAQHAHNVLLTVAAEAGLPAVLFLVAFTITVGVAILRAVRALTGRPEAMVVAGVGAALFGEVGHGLIDYTLGNPMLLALMWALTGVALAAGQLAAKREPLRPAPRAVAVEAGG